MRPSGNSRSGASETRGLSEWAARDFASEKNAITNELTQGVHAVLCIFGLFASCVAHAQDNSAPSPSAPPRFNAADLERLAAPIALHPEPLIAIHLPASV